MLKVNDLMTPDVFTLNTKDTLQSARQLMDMQRIRHVPIIDEDGVFVGLLTHRDILAATISKLAEIEPETQAEIDAGIPLVEIMSTDVVVVSPNLPLRDAASILLNHKYGCLPVVDAGRLVGILTEADFLKMTISLMDALESPDL